MTERSYWRPTDPRVYNERDYGVSSATATRAYETSQLFDKPTIGVVLNAVPSSQPGSIQTEFRSGVPPEFQSGYLVLSFCSNDASIGHDPGAQKWMQNLQTACASAHHKSSELNKEEKILWRMAEDLKKKDDSAVAHEIRDGLQYCVMTNDVADRLLDKKNIMIDLADNERTHSASVEQMLKAPIPRLPITTIGITSSGRTSVNKGTTWGQDSALGSFLQNHDNAVISTDSQDLRDLVAKHIATGNARNFKVGSKGSDNVSFVPLTEAKHDALTDDGFSKYGVRKVPPCHF